MACKGSGKTSVETLINKDTHKSESNPCKNRNFSRFNDRRYPSWLHCREGIKKILDGFSSLQGVN